MVLAVRRGSSLRRVAARFGVSLGTVQYWVTRAVGQRLGRIDFADRLRGTPQPANRTRRALERRIVNLRRKLRDHSPLGQHGAAAIAQALRDLRAKKIPTVRTIGRILARHGLLDGRRRPRRPPPCKGWYLPELAARRAEADSFDTVTDLTIKGGQNVTVLNGMSLHGGLPTSVPEAKISSKTVEKHLVKHWREFGLPHFSKFDNDVIFQGPHHWPDTFGRVTRLCLQLGVTPIFAPPREPGFQAEVEAFNGRWQRAVWQRFVHRGLPDLQRRSEAFVAAARRQAAERLAAAPERRPFPANFVIDYQRPLTGTVIYLRRANAQGTVECLGHRWLVDALWAHRLVRVEVDLTAGQVRCYRLRRREPADQPLIKMFTHRIQQKPFHD
jgi:hypothetical protein